MKIYQNLGISDYESNEGHAYIINTAEMIPGGFGDKDILALTFKQKGIGTEFGYGLIGEDVFKPFMAEMNAQTPEGLVGKMVLAYYTVDKTRAIGISIKS
jgi:hypothetical protein